MRRNILIFAALITVFACKKTEAPPTNTDFITKPPTATAPAPQPTQTTASAAPTSGAIAGTDGEKSATHIDITELKRTSGGTVNLKLVLSNNSDKELNVYGGWMGDNQVSKDSYRDISGIHLLDPANKKKYFVVTDSERSCVCSKNIEDLKPGQKVNLWAKFPAPPPEVTKVTIEIPHFQPMDDVPISQ
jgi:hypothetical protein